MGKRYPACLHLHTALPRMLLTFAMLTRDVAICSHEIIGLVKVPWKWRSQHGHRAQGHGVLGLTVVCNTSLLAWLRGEAAAPCRWGLEPIRLAFFGNLSQDLSQRPPKVKG